MDKINNQDAVNETRLTIKKKILKTNSFGELEIDSLGKNELCFKGLKRGLDMIIQDIECAALFDFHDHNHPLIMLIEEICYNLTTYVRPHEGTISLELMYKRCLHEEGHRIPKTYFDGELQQNDPALPIDEMMNLRESVICSAGKLITVNDHRELFIYLYLVRQKLLIPTDFAIKMGLKKCI